MSWQHKKQKSKLTGEHRSATRQCRKRIPHFSLNVLFRISLIFTVLPLFHISAETENDLEDILRRFEPIPHLKGHTIIFNSGVYLYQKPDMNSRRLLPLNPGDDVKILEQTKSKYLNGNIYRFHIYYWYKVKIKNKEGYAWGGDLAHHYLYDDINHDGEKEFFALRIHGMKVSLPDHFKFPVGNVDYRIIRRGKITYSNFVMTFGDHRVKSIEKKRIPGFDPAFHAVIVKFTETADGQQDVSRYFQITGNSYYLIYDHETHFASDGYTAYSKLIFPEDKGGKKNHLIEYYRSEDGRCDPDNAMSDLESPSCKGIKGTVRIKETTSYVWNGLAFNNTSKLYYLAEDKIAARKGPGIHHPPAFILNRGSHFVLIFKTENIKSPPPDNELRKWFYIQYNGRNAWIPNSASIRRVE